MTFHELAGEAYGCFERKQRPRRGLDTSDPESYATLKDGSPDWLQDLVRSAHGDFLPDDWRYEAIHSIIGGISDSGADDRREYEERSHEDLDGIVDTYNGERTAWLASNLQRGAYCDEGVEELGGDNLDIFERIGLGQYMEAQEIMASVLDSLTERMETLEMEEDGDDD